MRMLLTSNGIANAAVREALVDLLGKPVAESRVVVVIDAIQPVWFVDDDSALLVRDPAQDPVVISSGHWRRFGADGSLVESR